MTTGSMGNTCNLNSFNDGPNKMSLKTDILKFEQ